MSQQEVTLAVWDIHELNERIPGEWSAIDDFAVFWDAIEAQLVITALVERITTEDE